MDGEKTDLGSQGGRTLCPLGCRLVDPVLRQILRNHALGTRLDRRDQISLSHAVQFLPLLVF